MSLKKILADKFLVAIKTALGEEITCDPMIQLAARLEFGDYQANFAMGLAKQLKKNPVEIARNVVACLEPSIFAKVEVAGPGFINLFLANSFLDDNLQQLLKDERLGVSKTNQAETVTVDYGGANIAKEMHVGHLRSTIIGDAIVRILDFLGHHVIRQNHLGDWGTQFGMLIEYLLEENPQFAQHQISDLDAFYKQAKQHFDNDPEFANQARARVVALQAGDESTLEIWRQLVAESERHFAKVYQRLKVLLSQADARGESFYNFMLPGVVAEFLEKGIAVEDQGAIVIFLNNISEKDDRSVPFIIRKSDGAYLYATTDLATVKFRVETLKATRLIYVTDARQKQHFAMLFMAVRQIGWVGENIKFEHVPFGAILGKDHKPFKTRSGESIKLISLLDEAESRAAAVATAKNPDLSPEQVQQIAHVVGIGALKYADLSSDKVKDYVFDWDKMLAFEGNTAPYLQNAYVRVCSIFRKGAINLAELSSKKINIIDPNEHLLALKILEFPDVVYVVAADLSIHKLCNYLYELAATFHKFYEHCPVLSVTEEALRNTRLVLCALTARTLAMGLNLLGIAVLEQM
jgi:arginyl-tRNA synthetase